MNFPVAPLDGLISATSNLPSAPLLPSITITITIRQTVLRIPSPDAHRNHKLCVHALRILKGKAQPTPAAFSSSCLPVDAHAPFAPRRCAYVTAKYHMSVRTREVPVRTKCVMQPICSSSGPVRNLNMKDHEIYVARARISRPRPPQLHNCAKLSTELGVSDEEPQPGSWNPSSFRAHIERHLHVACVISTIAIPNIPSKVIVAGVAYSHKHAVDVGTSSLNTFSIEGNALSSIRV
jgi:hypothetical protein